MMKQPKPAQGLCNFWSKIQNEGNGGMREMAISVCVEWLLGFCSERK
jgi:hypothetical protein